MIEQIGLMGALSMSVIVGIMIGVFLKIAVQYDLSEENPKDKRICIIGCFSIIVLILFLHTVVITLPTLERFVPVETQTQQAFFIPSLD